MIEWRQTKGRTTPTQCPEQWQVGLNYRKVDGGLHWCLCILEALAFPQILHLPRGFHALAALAALVSIVAFLCSHPRKDPIATNHFVTIWKGKIKPKRLLCHSRAAMSLVLASPARLVEGLLYPFLLESLVISQATVRVIANRNF